jgi:hypothetical protein
MKTPQQFSFGVMENIHIIFDGIQRPEDEVEKANICAQFAGQLPDHQSKRTRNIVKSGEAKCEVFVWFSLVRDSFFSGFSIPKSQFVKCG